MMFLDCPASVNRESTPRCGLPAEIRCRFIMQSTDGPIESAMIRCPVGHHFCGAVESLTWDGKDENDAGPAAASSRAQREHFPIRPVLEGPRPYTTPAYYLGRAAGLWITVMRGRSSSSLPSAVR